MLHRNDADSFAQGLPSKLLLGLLPVCVLFLCVLFLGAATSPGQEKKSEPFSGKPFLRGHAHNDYYQKRPLLDALDQGFCSVEADVFLQDGQLYVAHTFLEIRKARTLDNLYLQPLFKRVQTHRGSVHQKGDRFCLLIDFKSAASESLNRLNESLKPFAEFLTRLENGKVIEGAVTVVISGNRPKQEIVKAKDRLVFLDGRLNDPPAWGKEISPLISESWNSHFKYRGFGDMNPGDQAKLKRMVIKVHRAGKRLRFWALPDRKKGWQVAYLSGVDLINTDKLAELREYIHTIEHAR